MQRVSQSLLLKVCSIKATGTHCSTCCFLIVRSSSPGWVKTTGSCSWLKVMNVEYNNHWGPHPAFGPQNPSRYCLLCGTCSLWGPQSILRGSCHLEVPCPHQNRVPFEEPIPWEMPVPFEKTIHCEDPFQLRNLSAYRPHPHYRACLLYRPRLLYRSRPLCGVTFITDHTPVMEHVYIFLPQYWYS